MTAKNFLSLYAIIALIYGIVFLFLPGTAYDLYGLADQSSPLSTNLLGGLGGLFIAGAIMGWLARDASISRGRKAILVFITLSSAIFLIRNIMGLAGGASFGTISYIDLIVQALFTIGGGYLVMKENTD
jgi:hypothetical protein